MKAVEKVAFNTGVLYARLLLQVAIGLFTTRIVLKVLGETNYGIYTLVGGVIGLLAILQSTMSNTSMRYMAHSLGSGDERLVSDTFNTTLKLHFVIGVVLVVLMEVGGFFMFEYMLDIPADKYFDARVIFHFMVATTFIAIIAVPYDAVINAHENLLLLAVVDVGGSALNLVVALLLSLANSNLLIWYGLGIFLVQLLKRVTKQVYAQISYKEAKFRREQSLNKELSYEIMKFSMWNLLGSIASVAVTQVRSILINIFFGVRLNASEGIAKSSTSQINTLSTNLSRAINPQLNKSEGGGNRKRMINITILSTKLTSFLFIILVIPIFIELPNLFNIWLDTVPEFAVVFSRLILIGMLLEKFTFGIIDALRAVGEIKQFQIAETVLVLSGLPIIYLLFSNGYPAETMYIVSIITAVVAGGFRLYFGKKIANINPLFYIRRTIIPLVMPLLFGSLIGFLIINTMEESFFRFVLLFAISITVSIFTLWVWGLEKNEKEIVRSLINKIILWKQK